MNFKTFNVILACVFVAVLAFAANVEANRGGKGGGSIIILGGQNHGHHQSYMPFPVMMGGWGCGHSSFGHGGWGHGSSGFRR